MPKISIHFDHPTDGPDAAARAAISIPELGIAGRLLAPGKTLTLNVLPDIYTIEVDVRTRDEAAWTITVTTPANTQSEDGVGPGFAPFPNVVVGSSLRRITPQSIAAPQTASATATVTVNVSTSSKTRVSVTVDLEPDSAFTSNFASEADELDEVVEIIEVADEEESEVEQDSHE